ncbi:hypothetical protein ACFOD4_04485 [Pseudoroseomonas globiformis]|uniref:DUF2267 domain-containing protein n=1 Tax=Teichococcus globiformis TaxID=2307229 RepID=A0ABV7FVA8_9PROT
MSDISTLLIPPTTAFRVRRVIQQALDTATVREAAGEGRGFLRALCPALPATVVAQAVEDILADLDPFLPDLLDCEPDARKPPGQMSLGF